VAHGFRKILASVEIGISVIHILDDRPADALAALQRASEMSVSIGDDAVEGDILAQRAQACASLGQYAEALEWLRKTTDFLRRSGELALVELSRAHQACLHIILGDGEAARALMGQPGEISRNTMENLVQSACFPAFCIGMGDYPIAARLQGYVGATWPRLQKNRLLNGVLFRWCGQKLADEVSEDALAPWLLEGAALSESQASEITARVTERFVTGVDK
jgi:tetratricopeptide (TPR) repeat protein